MESGDPLQGSGQPGKGSAHIDHAEESARTAGEGPIELYGDPPTHSERVCVELLGRLLPSTEELLEALAPDGWERSPLSRIFHPTPDQLRAEHARLRRRLASLSAESGSEEETAANDEVEETPARPIEPEREVVELMGMALWDVFSDNHSVIDREGIEYDLGSFRGSAALIAEAIEERYSMLGFRYGYLDFFMGTSLVWQRADLLPVYRWIFERLREAGCDWRYSFPRLHLIQFAEEEGEGFEAYDPSEAVRVELERAEQTEEHRALADALERDYQDAIRRARFRPLPATVEAYRKVYGELPVGWPHPDM